MSNRLGDSPGKSLVTTLLYEHGGQKCAWMNACGWCSSCICMLAVWAASQPKAPLSASDVCFPDGHNASQKPSKTATCRQQPDRQPASMAPGQACREADIAWHLKQQHLICACWCVFELGFPFRAVPCLILESCGPECRKHGANQFGSSFQISRTPYKEQGLKNGCL